MLDKGAPEETYYEQAERYVRELRILTETHIKEVLNGIPDPIKNMEKIGIIRGLKKALEMFEKR